MTLPETKLVESLEDVDYAGMKMPMFVLYRYPSDFPDNIVVRVWDLNVPTNIAWLAKTIAEARAAVPAHFTRFARDDSDDPVIIESYI